VDPSGETLQVGAVQNGGEFDYSYTVCIMLPVFMQLNSSSLIKVWGNPDSSTTEIPDGYACISTGYNWIKETICREVPNDVVFCLGESSKQSESSQQIHVKASKMM
jgi:hypothetical protein